MKPDDLIDAMEYISEDLVEEARNHRQTPPAWLRWGSLAICVCCAVLAVGSFALRLHNSTGEGATEAASTVSAPEEEKQTEPLQEEVSIPLEIPDSGEALHSQPIGYDICVQGDMMYFLDSYTTVYAYNAQTQTVKAIFTGENCVLVQTATGVYCKSDSAEGASIEDLTQEPVENLGTVEGSGIDLIDVVDGTIYWTRQNENTMELCGKSMDTGETQVLYSADFIGDSMLRSNVLYYQNETGHILSFDLGTGETGEFPWTYDEGSEVSGTVFLQDFILQYVDTYDQREDGSLSEERSFYLISYDTGEKEQLPGYDGDLYWRSQAGNELYFEVYHSIPDSGGWVEYVAYDISTGTFTPLATDELMNDATEVKAFAGGFYYTVPDASDGGLYRYDIDTGTNTLICHSVS
jgi:hypothetical protein